tara:strand:+ start:514 stop:2025 length:1512 start_codon:yes stop_codon:yes gene_type:complete
MAVPTSGRLDLIKLAREAKYADYFGTQNMGTVSLYDIVNGGNAHGSTLSYPPLNRNCLPNPTGSLPNNAANPCSQGLDVCFIIDYTGSMGGVIETVKDGLADVIAHINTESSSDYRLSMITVDEKSNANPTYAACSQYTSLPASQKVVNQGASGKYQIITAWEMFPPTSNNNSTTFTTAVDNLNGGVSGSSCIQLGNGVNGPEPMDLGLGLVINSNNFVNDFRSQAAKYIIMITDAAPGGGDDAFTSDDYYNVLTLTATCVFRGIKVFVLGLGVNSNITISGTVRYPWRELADQTGGTWDTTYDTTDVEEDITVACEGDGVYVPYKFSAWYGYDKDCTTGIVPFNTSFISATQTGACASTINQTYYHNGTGTLPAVGDDCYANQSLTTVLDAGYYITSTVSGGSGFRITGTAGTVASLFFCVTLTQFPGSSGQPGIKFICDQSASTNYWHDGSASYPQVGDTVYTDSAGTATTSSRYINLGLSYLTFSNLNGVVTNLDICNPP